MARPSPIKRAWLWLRPFLLVAALIGAYCAWSDPALRTTIGLPLPSGEVISARFAACDAPGYATNCVVDGDTFRLGPRRIRIEGIDAPEREARCEAERVGAQKAAADLLAWLERGPFQMIPKDNAPHDQYGRELQTVWRESADGARDDLAGHMIRIGSARHYDSRGKLSWC